MIAELRQRRRPLCATTLWKPSGKLAAKAGGRNDHTTREVVQNALQQRVLLYDKQGEEHFNLISALHKSIRNSDADAALYWLGRMLQWGRGSDVPGAAAGADGGRRYRAGGAGGVADGAGGAGCDGFSGIAGGRPGVGAGGGVPGAGAEIECAVYRVYSEISGGDCGASGRAGAAAFAQRGDSG